MGFVPGYENDIFISYAHNDNSTHKDDKRNWVSLLEDYIRTRARGRGHELGIFCDAQLGNFTGVNQQLADHIANSAIFICVVSPNYAKSKWCLWEMEQTIRQGRLDRVLRIGKYPLDDSELMPQQSALLQKTDDLLEARFYSLDESKKLVSDLQPELFTEHLTEFYKRLNPIVDNIIARLKELRAAHVPLPGTAIEVSGESQVAVYLAETAKDLVKERELVRSELAQFNYRMLPDQPLPQDADQLHEAIRDHLQKAKLSVHLVGASYGTILDGEDRSTPHVQYDLATEMSKQGQIKQIVWLPPDLASSGRQQEFVTNLKNNSPDYLQTKLEDLKTVIQKKLQPDAPNIWEDDETDPVNLCLVCHEEDEDLIRPLFNHLTFNEPFNVKVLTNSLQGHKQLLQTSDAVLMYYGKAGQDWFTSILKLVKKHSVAGRAKPILARAIYTGQPPTPEKDLLEFDDPLVIKSYEAFTPSVLMPFIERIRIAKGGAL